MDLPEFGDRQSYLEFLKQEARLPAGFSTATGRISFTPSERPSLEPYRMDLSLILADKPTEQFGALFTRNAFPGAPVILGRERLDGSLQGVLINNKIANVRSRTGLADARRLVHALSRASSASEDSLLSVSTGIIGWSLPVQEMEEAVPGLVSSLRSETAIDVAQAIMTTDSFAKVRRVQMGGGSILGVAKGAGMIEPNMATMLVFLLTDLDIPREALRRALRKATEQSFNAISVDGDMSTSDMVLLMSSAARGTVDEHLFQHALTGLCEALAKDIVRNGEGTGHVIEATVDGLQSDDHARAAAKAVVNSPLVKTAVYGNDPNVGRLLSSLGDFFGTHQIPFDPESMEIHLGGEVVFTRGAFELDREKEIRLTDYLKHAALNPRVTGFPQHQRLVEVVIGCGPGPGRATVWGSDLSDHYVHENADYRT